MHFPCKDGGISAVESPYPIFSPLPSFRIQRTHVRICSGRPHGKLFPRLSCRVAAGKATDGSECVGARPYSQRPNPARGVSAARCRRGYHQPIIVWKVVFSRPYGQRMRLRRNRCVPRRTAAPSTNSPAPALAEQPARCVPLPSLSDLFHDAFLDLFTVCVSMFIALICLVSSIFIGIQ
jgi:hypothetical protein